jgi:hypothetical protein
MGGGDVVLVQVLAGAQSALAAASSSLTCHHEVCIHAVRGIIRQRTLARSLVGKPWGRRLRCVGQCG